MFDIVHAMRERIVASGELDGKCLAGDRGGTRHGAFEMVRGVGS